ncbi:MAG TPA: type II toxin-antitoxin system death-on-curing family toxin [Pyrinomonadaceae bacterium]
MGSSCETLTIDEICEINRQQIDAFGGLFLSGGNFHNRGSLEYALSAIDAEIFGTPLYPTLEAKAAYLAFSIITNHVFHDGNKRTALTACRIFLLLNGFDLNISTDEPDEVAMNAAECIAKKLTALDEFTSWVAENMTELDVE